MRKLINLVSENTSHPSILRTLEEGKKEVMQMFKPLRDLAHKYGLDGLKPYFDDIEFVIKELKRADRQTWAARYMRYELVHMLQSSPILTRNLSKDRENFDFDELKKELEELRQKYFPYKDNTMHTYYRSEILRKIVNHFLGINYAPIQNYIFKDQSFDQVIDDLTALENKYKETVSGKLTLRKDDEIVAHLGEYIWVLLDRGYCSEEAEAMGHCGNIGAQSGDRILSLRKFAERLDGVDYYDVYLTFILDSEGRLGEMKGRANEKPAARYHPFIIELLKLPLIKGVKGGGYLPQNNRVAQASPHQRGKGRRLPTSEQFLTR